MRKVMRLAESGFLDRDIDLSQFDMDMLEGRC